MWMNVHEYVCVCARARLRHRERWENVNGGREMMRGSVDRLLEDSHNNKRTHAHSHTPAHARPHTDMHTCLLYTSDAADEL